MKTLARLVGSMPSHDHPIKLQDLLLEAEQLSAERGKARTGNLRHPFVARVAGEPEEAIRSFERAIRLSPFNPMRFVTFTGRGIAFLSLGRFDEAVVAAKKALSENQAFSTAYRCLASALAHLGREAEAREAAAGLLELEPDFRISEWVARGGVSPLQLYIDGLRKAGVPE
jgi:adenylate cyclase